MREFKFPNNHAWPGITALLYKISVERFCRNDNTLIKEEYYGLSEIGVEWKKTSDSSWVTVRVSPESYSCYYCHHFLWNYNVLDNGYRIFNSTARNEYCTYPTILLIENLEPNTSYDVRTYYVLNGEKETYNAQTIATLNKEPFTFEFEEPTYDSSMDGVEIDYENVKNMLSCALVQLKEIYAMFLHSLEGNEMYNVTIVRNVDFVAAIYSSTNHIIINYEYLKREVNDNNVSLLFSFLVHEMAHDKLANDDHITNNITKQYSETQLVYLDKVIKFMEFATSSPYACWQWKGIHNFPLISSAGYGYVENCLIAAACELSQEAMYC